MFFHGYRPIDGAQHKTVVEFCGHVLGKDFGEAVRHFGAMRQKRNRFNYDEADLIVSETETKNALDRAREFVDKVSKHIQKNNQQQKLI